MEQKNETPPLTSAVKHKWAGMLKWLFRGILLIIGCIILILAGLIVPEYFRAGGPPGGRKSRPALLEPASVEKADTGQAIVTHAQGNVNASMVASKINPADRTLNLTSGTAPSNAAPRLKYKPFIHADPALDAKLKQEQKERLNKRFDELLARIAKYEELQGSMHPEAVEMEKRIINGEYENCMNELAPLLDLPANPHMIMGITPYAHLNRRIHEYLQWHYSSWAILCARRNRYDMVVLHLQSARAYMEYAYLDVMRATPNGWKNVSIADFHRSKEYQELWNHELYYWRRIGGLKGFKGIGESVLNIKLREIGWGIKKLHR